MTTRTKLCVLVPSLRYGGAERVVTTLLRHIDRARFDVTLVVVDGRYDELRSAIPADLPVEDLRCHRVLTAIPRMLGMAWRLRPDVIFSVIGHLNVTLALLRPVLPRRVRLVAREATMVSAGRPTGVKGVLLRFSYWLLYRRAHRVICQSDEMKVDLIRMVGASEAQCVVIPNPVDVALVRRLSSEPLAPSDEEAFGADSRTVLVAVGRLSPKKGFDLLVQAVAIVSDPNMRVLVVGEGAERARLESLASSLGVANQIAFLGYRANPYAFIGRCDAFVLSSRVEGLPNVVLEALCCGVPILALPAVGVTRRLLSNRQSCWVAESVSAGALAATITAWRTAGGHAPVEHDVSEFSATAVTRIYERVFCSLVEETA